MKPHLQYLFNVLRASRPLGCVQFNIKTVFKQNKISSSLLYTPKIVATRSQLRSINIWFMLQIFHGYGWRAQFRYKKFHHFIKPL